ncbi:trigger factor [Mariniphaga anaerophila]|uniref:Trigger factor n=1 Tax=Mariniphaga anaerophila TaxID=1484053 RepID=A0A1M5CAV8_9BACT|nr:trigger factor [Mariniphaga anaerophila]SHF51841.1 trigger factor [Mariniphaga anaerophila]
MKVTRENIDNVNAVIKVLIEKSDYEQSVEDTLKDYRHKASIPGFRPGKAPMGLIKRRFEKSVMVEEINKVLSQNLTRYLVDEKLQVLGEPLASTEHQKPIDWENDEAFEFAFDVALAPTVEVPLSEEDKLQYFTIKVSDDMVEEQVNMITSQMGQNVDADEAKDKSLVRGDFVELDEEGNPKEDGIKADGVLLSVDLIKNEEIKKQFLGKQKGEVLTFDPVAAYEDRHEVGHLLKISHEQADELNSNFSFTITEILDYQKAELNEELYKKIYGEDTDVKTEEDLRNKLKEEIANSLLHSSDTRFAYDTRDALVEKVNPELPEAFLKRWLKEANKEATDEQIEKDFDGFLKDLRWQLIKDFIIKENELKVEDEEAVDLAKKIAHAQYSQYGIYNAPEDQLESFAKMILEKPEEKERLYSKILEDKVIDVVKGKVTLESKEVTREEFEEMAK